MSNMQRNVRGGKAYKKQKKHPTEGTKRDRFTGRDDGQNYGRVLAMLGDRRVRCFCNDGAERICKIRGRLCKGRNKKLIAVGDIVLISPRDFMDESDSDEDSGGKKGSAATDDGAWDLIDRIERDDWRAVKKEAGIHRDLFGVMMTEGGTVHDDIFEDAGAPDTANTSGGLHDNEEDELDVDAI
jgi:initiation factor 1A